MKQGASMNEQDNIQYVFSDKPVEALKDCKPKEVWVYVKGEWLKFKKEQA